MLKNPRKCDFINIPTERSIFIILVCGMGGDTLPFLILRQKLDEPFRRNYTEMSVLAGEVAVP